MMKDDFRFLLDKLIDLGKIVSSLESQVKALHDDLEEFKERENDRFRLKPTWVSALIGAAGVALMIFSLFRK